MNEDLCPLVLRRHYDRAQAWNHYLAGACVALLMGLLYFALKAPPAPAPCPASGVMQLDPTTVRARALESVEL